MKRIILSILSGVVIPIIYTIVAAFISELLPQYNLDRMQVKGQASLGLIFAPIAIPFWIYNYIRFYQYLGLRFIFDTVWFRVTFTFGFNFALYAILSYLTFRYFGILNNAKSENYQDPPLPPKF